MGQKKSLGKKNFGSKRFGSGFFVQKKQVGLTPENSRVKIVLGCCLLCLVRLPTKFQTPRIIISGRSRVPGGGWVGGGCEK